MNIFDIIGPVMVGPSSSHTAGAARIGAMARKILGETPKKARILFHGSFANTYKGHGSDKAVIGGLLGFAPDDMRIRDSLSIAEEEGLDFKFETITLDDTHPNTIVIIAETENGKHINMQGASVGGGNIIIQKLGGIDVDFNGNFDTLIIEHTDAPGVIAHVTNYLASRRINIANMKVFRSSKGGPSIMIIETDGYLPGDISSDIQKIDRITGSTAIAKIS